MIQILIIRSNQFSGDLSSRVTYRGRCTTAQGCHHHVHSNHNNYSIYLRENFTNYYKLQSSLSSIIQLPRPMYLLSVCSMNSNEFSQFSLDPRMTLWPRFGLFNPRRPSLMLLTFPQLIPTKQITVQLLPPRIRYST